MGKIKFIESGYDVPVIEFRLNDGEKRYGIIDTGSEITIVNSGLSTETDEKIDIVCVSGNKRLEKSVSDVEFAFDHIDETTSKIAHKSLLLDFKTVNLDFVEREIKIDAIFGIDILKRMNALIDLEGNFIEINY